MKSHARVYIAAPAAPPLAQLVVRPRRFRFRTLGRVERGGRGFSARERGWRLDARRGRRRRTPCVLLADGPGDEQDVRIRPLPCPGRRRQETSLRAAGRARGDISPNLRPRR